jgi:N-formylglutamate amidohydrolase
MRDPEQARLRLEDRYVDAIATRLAAETGASLLVAQAPRALIDLNRSVEDVDWSMISGEVLRSSRHSVANRRSRNGLGLVPRRIPGLGEIWRGQTPAAQLEARIAGIYRPYHAALGAELDRLRDAWGAALLVDLHSMPPLRPAGPEDRPAQFVVGDRFGASCHPGLVDMTLRYFGDHRRRVSLNRPYSGGYILDRFGHPRRGIHALQLETCRSTYLDTRLDQPSARIVSVARLLAGLVRALAAEVGEIGGAGRLAQAAE